MSASAERLLCKERLFDDTLPAKWSGLLDQILAIRRLKRDKYRTHEERREEAFPIYSQLMRDAASLVEPQIEGGFDARLWFTESVLLWMRHAETGSRPLIDSIGTSTLDDFPVDLPPDDEARARIRAALKQALEWDEDDLQRVEQRIAHICSNLDLKGAITRAIVKYLEARGGPTPEALMNLMRAVFGPTPWRPGDVHVVMTTTTLFFCIRREKGTLREPDWDERSEEEKAGIMAFLSALRVANTPETHHFPTFGMFNRDALDPKFVEELLLLVQDSGIQTREQVLVDTLATMMTVLKTPQVEMYLVHDTWGHTWQEALAEFEHEYAFMCELDDPFSPDDGPGHGDPTTPRLITAFVAKDGRTEVDHDVLLRFAEGDLRARIQIANSVVIAELLADFTEAKYARLCPEGGMTTSSLIPPTNLKLDLSIADLRRQLWRVKRRYQQLAEDEQQRAELARQLAERGLPELGLQDAVAESASAMWSAFSDKLSLKVGPEEVGPDTIRSTVFRRMLLKLVLVMAELDRVLDSLVERADPAWTEPRSCVDLVALSTSHFYEHDRQRKFWRLDQMLRHELPLFVSRLRAAL